MKNPSSHQHGTCGSVPGRSVPLGTLPSSNDISRRETIPGPDPKPADREGVLARDLASALKVSDEESGFGVRLAARGREEIFAWGFRLLLGGGK